MPENDGRFLSGGAVCVPLRSTFHFQLFTMYVARWLGFSHGMLLPVRLAVHLPVGTIHIANFHTALTRINLTHRWPPVLNRRETLIEKRTTEIIHSRRSCVSCFKRTSRAIDLNCSNPYDQTRTIDLLKKKKKQDNRSELRWSLWIHLSHRSLSNLTAGTIWYLSYFFGWKI